MGLDMYLCGEKYHRQYNKGEELERPTTDGIPQKSVQLDLGYWRKHPNLHGYIVNTYAEGKDECQEIMLNANDLEDIACAIELDRLPHTEGFFFGTSEWHEEDKKENAEIFRRAKAWLESYPEEDRIWNHVYYKASW